MRKVALIVIGKFNKEVFFNYINAGKDFVDNMELEYERIDVIITSGYEHVIALELPFVQTVMRIGDVYKFYDNVIVLGEEEDTVTYIKQIIAKTTIALKENDEYIFDDLESNLIEDYVKDSYVIGKDNNEINTFINIYLDKLKELQVEGDKTTIEDIKEGLGILYNRLKN